MGESGAYNGVAHSNSLFFETTRRWKCLLVEPNPNLQQQVIANGRGCHLFQGGLSITGRASSFDFRMAGPLGGIASTFSASQTARTQREFKAHEASGSKRIHEDWTMQQVKVQCLPLVDILRSMNRTTVDYWSLDVEGAEAAILEHTDFDSI